MLPTSDPTRACLPLRAAGLAAAVLIVVIVSVSVLPLRLAAIAVGLGIAMVAIAAIDADHFIIPDRLSLPAIPAGLLASGYWVDPGAAGVVAMSHLLGAAVGGGSLWALAALYRRWRGMEGLGFGDVKLAAAGGAWVGLDLLSLVLLVAAGGALLVVTAMIAWGKPGIDRQARVPFGTFLAPSIWGVWVASVAGYI
jgi:leader peptidase (prepilin peptidase) / N-methyltransferase